MWWLGAAGGGDGVAIVPGFVLEGNRGDGLWFVASLDELAARFGAG